MIYAFVGKMGSGKNYCTLIWQYLLAYYNAGCTHPQTKKNFKSFVDNKHHLKSSFESHCFAQKIKISLENHFPHEFNIDNWENNGIEYRNGIISSLNISRRQALQQFGTKMREISTDYWVNALLNDYDYLLNKTKERPNWLITDLRYLNEASAIKKRYGVIIRVIKLANTDLQNACEHATKVLQERHPCEDLFEKDDIETVGTEKLKSKFESKFNVLYDDYLNALKKDIKDTHSSEVEQDEIIADYTIFAAHGDFDSLLDQIKKIMILEKIIKNVKYE